MSARPAPWAAVIALALAVAWPAVAAIEVGEFVIRKGNLIEVVGPDASVDLQALVDEILDASATNRYLIRLGPGDYDMGMETLVLKPYVDLEGSGRDTTEIVGEVELEAEGSGVRSDSKRRAGKPAPHSSEWAVRRASGTRFCTNGSRS